MDLRKTPNFKLRVVLLNIIKKISEIGPFRKPLALYSAPPSLSREEATRWVKGISQGEIGGLEAFLSENEVSIQLMNYDRALDKDKRNNECSFIHPIPSPIQETESFQFFLKKPSIYSIFQEDAESWLNDLEFINGEAWIQVWFQKDKHDKWRELLKQQYEDYLKGISYPSTIVPIRKLQLKVAELSRNINVSIPTISTFEERKNQNIYRFFIRGYVRGEKTERKDFISRLLTRLNRQSKENEWGVSCKIGVKKEQLDKWKTLKVPYLTTYSSLYCGK